MHEKEKNESIESMPGCTRWSLNGLLNEISEAHELGIGAIALFPAIDSNLKSPDAEESFNDSGLIPKSIRSIKNKFP